jgi:hypothetical protein
MTARKAAHRYSANDERATLGFATVLLHHPVGHDPSKNPDPWWCYIPMIRRANSF